MTGITYRLADVQVTHPWCDKCSRASSPSQPYPTHRQGIGGLQLSPSPGKLMNGDNAMSTNKHHFNQTADSMSINHEELLSNVVQMPERQSAAITTDFDVITELEQNRDQYTGPERFDLCEIPNYLFICLDRIRARVTTTPKPSHSATIACCMSFGLESISTNREIQTLLKLKSRLHMTEGVEAGSVNEVASWFRNFSLGIPDWTMSGVRRQVATVPAAIMMEAHDLADEIGTSAPILAMLAVISTLSTQPSMLDEHREMLTETISMFLKRIHQRNEMAEMMQKFLEERRHE